MHVAPVLAVLQAVAVVPAEEVEEAVPVQGGWWWARWRWWWATPVKSCPLGLSHVRVGGKEDASFNRKLEKSHDEKLPRPGSRFGHVLASASAEVALGAVAVKQKTFSSPEEGVKALIDAAKKNDTKGILEILGPEAKSIIQWGDPVADNAARERFVKSYEEANKLVKSGETEMVSGVPEKTIGRFRFRS